MGNFHIYSYRELLAHNSYLEILAELGVVGLVAYLTVIFAPLRSLRHLELVTVGKRDDMSNDSYYLSVGLQAALGAYIVCSFFASMQYQWFLYYPVAYAVSLRRIDDLEKRRSSSSDVTSRADGTVWSHPKEGLLWHSYQRFNPSSEKLGYGR